MRDAMATTSSHAPSSAGIERATRLVEQLLVLARQEASAAPHQPVVLADLAKRAVADLIGVDKTLLLIALLIALAAWISVRIAPGRAPWAE